MYEEGLKKTGRNIVLAIFAIIVGILTFLSMFLNTNPPTVTSEIVYIIGWNAKKGIKYAASL